MIACLHPRCRCRGSFPGSSRPYLGARGWVQQLPAPLGFPLPPHLHAHDLGYDYLHIGEDDVLPLDEMSRVAPVVSVGHHAVDVDEDTTVARLRDRPLRAAELDRTRETDVVQARSHVRLRRRSYVAEAALLQAPEHTGDHAAPDPVLLTRCPDSPEEVGARSQPDYERP